MARATDGASGPALGKPARVPASGLTSPGGERAKGAEKPARSGRLPARRLPRVWTVALQFLNEVRAEMNRVAWPDRQTVIASTVVVVFVLVVTSLYLGLWDYLFATLFTSVFK
ncbi:MAG TPA: preprotein translocase subunit SecE [bacterium]|nr:preprotein translocase subunit SecE [bacterium]